MAMVESRGISQSRPSNKTSLAYFDVRHLLAVQLPTFSFPLRSLDATSSPFLLNRFHGDAENQLVGRWCDDEFMKGEGSPWPLVLYGPSGTGKSALAETLATRLKLHCLRLTGDDFRRQFLNAISTKSIDTFRRHLFSFEMFVIENICLTDDQPQWVREFAQFLDHCEQNQKPLIATAIQLPPALGSLATIRSRLSCGLVIEIKHPGLAAKRTIANDLLKRFNLKILDEDLEWWAKSLPATAPLIRNHITKVALATTDSMVSRETIRSCAKDVSGAEISEQVDQLLRLVSRRLSIRRSRILSLSRDKEVVRARSIAMYVSRELTGATFREIGKMIGGRDPSTVRHAYAQTKRQLSTDPFISESVLTISSSFRNQTNRGKIC